MGKGSSSILMVGCMKEIGKMGPCMGKGICITLMGSLHMKGNGIIMLSVGRGLFIMKSPSLWTTPSTIQTSTTFRSTGRSTKENSKMTIKKDSVHSIW